MSKSKKQTKYEYYAVTGGKNTINPPFNVGDIIKQRYTTDRNGDLTDGREKHEFIGMKGDMMLLKTLNSYAAYSEDIFSDLAVMKIKELGYNPGIGQTLQLHYMYADRYELIKK